MQVGSIYGVWIFWAIIYFVGLTVFNFIEPFGHLAELIRWIFWGGDSVESYIEQGRLTLSEAKDLYLIHNPSGTALPESTLVYRTYAEFRLTGEIMYMEEGYTVWVYHALYRVDEFIREIWLVGCVIAGFIGGVKVVRNRQKAGVESIPELTMGVNKRRDD